MARYDQVRQMLFDIATSSVRLPRVWNGAVPPSWLGICGCTVFLGWRAQGGRCGSCHKGYRQLPYMDVLLAAWLLGGAQALMTTAEGLFNDLPSRP